MNKKGFTLIELLAILVIVPLLIIIAYPAVNKYLEQTTNQYYETLEKNVRLAARDFATDNRNFLPKTIGTYKRITLEQIIKYKELEQITDKHGNTCQSGYVVIEKKDTNNYQYTTCMVCGEYKTENEVCEKEDFKYEVNYVLKHNNQKGETYTENTWSGTNIYQEFTNNQQHGVRIDTYQRQLDEGPWEDFEGNSFILEESHKVCVRAIDINGNISDVSCYQVRIDKEPITVVKKAEKTTYNYQSSEYNTTKISDLFTFGRFGPSGGTITCKSEITTLYENNNGTVTINKKVSDLGLARNTNITCESITGAKIKRSEETTVEIIAKSITTLNPNGGSVNPTSIEVIYGEKYTSLPTAERTGYTFDGWYTSSSGGTKITSTSTVQITSNQTLYAHWSANSYTVTFNPNGGSVNPTSKTVTYASTYGSLPTPTRTGYTFDGWYTSSSGGTKITSTTTVTTAQKQTLYAHWSANKYTVMLNPNGGSVNPTSKTVTYASTYGSLPTPERTGYTFEGWYTSISGGSKITTNSIVQITSTQTLYAHWRIEITFTSQDFDFKTEPQPFKVPATALYKLEVWGAQGGTVNGGKGGYSYGTIELSADDIIYVVVGGQPADYSGAGGYNGGGTGGNSSHNRGGGGGATHISTTATLLKDTLKENLYIVAGGGGGGTVNEGGVLYEGVLDFLTSAEGGAGGGTLGGDGSASIGKYIGIDAYTYPEEGNCPDCFESFATGGSYDATGGLGGSYGGGLGGIGRDLDLNEYIGQNGSYGQGGNGGKWEAGGGGGFYGGGASGVTAYYTASGGGGCGYISDEMEGDTLDGIFSIKNPRTNEFSEGNPGNGYARITILP